MANKTNTFLFKGDSSVSRPGTHSKTKSSNHKSSKHYKKNYRGQGR
jgi:hypothetical protein|tara:strand:- start:247 stop:384 length:138 start_codon:yes stop_codon:yes gene_type:complete